MSFEIIRTLPSPEEILSEIALTKELKEIKTRKDKEIADIITGVSKKFLLIIGPCSADNEDSVCDYISRLAKVQEKVVDNILIVPRIYTNKPRTNGLGYKGMLHQPDPNQKENMLEGIKQIRRLHVRAMKESHLTAADEMLYPNNYAYVKDLISYLAVGARSTENQQHRLVASGADIATGMKNPMCGDISVMLNSIKAAQSSHTFIYDREEVCSTGNTLAHGILRGAVDHYGRNIPNYHYEDVLNTAQEYTESGLINPTLIIDTNHSNSGKKYAEQPRIAMEIIKKRKYSEILKNMVKGLMIESYIEEGTQKVEEGVYGKSITDPCLGWADTEKLIMKIAEKL
ncbi:MAG TPA: 3-deoxy-7-phosphoheptulonate synthase [Clostridiales bacterium]|nr:MAG: 3-deoxy-7-phosphoheptulonate synthase [Clostridiales bacterium GWD2_32_19]HCC07814.1 3-deoxy-7-phosphoheptulonate synthase [Clostridiales bacterium]